MRSSSRVDRRIAAVAAHVACEGTTTLTAQQTAGGEAYKQARLACRMEMSKFINEINCNAILIRLAWHDSGTYDASVSAPFPAAGGANGSIRFEPEINHGANAGLIKAVGYVQKFKDMFPILSWADIMQMGSALAVELAGGPKIPMRYGRVDATSPEQCAKEGNLPAAGGPFDDGAKNAAEHLRNVFHRMGFSDQEIVALSGAHTLGRAFKNRSGTVPNASGEGNGTKYTEEGFKARADGGEFVGMAGGKSWTEKWLKFDNSYFNSRSDENLLVLETDRVINQDPSFKKYYEKYAGSNEAFFKDYAAAHSKLSELGSKFEPASGIYID